MYNVVSLQLLPTGLIDAHETSYFFQSCSRRTVQKPSSHPNWSRMQAKLTQAWPAMHWRQTQAGRACWEVRCPATARHIQAHGGPPLHPHNPNQSSATRLGLS